MQQYKKILGKVMMTAEGTYDSNKGYDPISLITDEETGKSYISRKEVPAGTQINNREYWQPVASSGIIDNGVIILNRKNNDGQIPIYDLKSAAEAVSVGDRKGGVILGFLGFNPEIDTVPTWKLYQYNDVSPSNWTNIDYWLPMDYTNKYAGWFDNEKALYDSVPFPKVGMYAYVGNSVSSAVVYRCYNDRVWQPTEDKAFSGVVNLADEEDITSKQNKLKFKDKEYNPAQYNGLGRIYLRKNMIDGKNILTQEMIEATNTIYIIQYDYDLQGETITVPEGCVLDFQGGSFSNGIINITKAHIKGNGVTLNDIYIIAEGNSINISDVKFDITNQNDIVINIKNSNHIYLSGLMFFNDNIYSSENDLGNIAIYSSKYITIHNCVLNGGMSTGVGKPESSSLLVYSSEYIDINNLLIRDCPAEGVYILGSKYISVSNSKGERCGWSFITAASINETTPSLYISVDGCSCYDSGASGYSFNCSESVLSNSIAIDYKTNNGVAIGHPEDKVWNVVVSNCYFRAKLGENAHKYTFGARTFSSGKITICNCQFEGDMFGGIGITGKDSDIIITNNTFSDITRFVHIHPYDLAVVNDNINVYANNNIINKCNTLILNELITSKIEFKNNTIKEVNCIYDANSVSKEVIFSNNVVCNIGIFTNSSIYRVRHFVVNSNRFINVFEQGNNVFFEITSGTNVSNAPNIEIYDNVFDYYKKLIHIIYLRSGTLQENISGNISVYNNIINNLENFDSFDCIAISLTGNINMLINNNIIKNIGYSNKGTTENRPTKYLTNEDKGFQYFDTILNKPVYWIGTKWVDATGTEL